MRPQRPLSTSWPLAVLKAQGRHLYYFFLDRVHQYTYPYTFIWKSYHYFLRYEFFKHITMVVKLDFLTMCSFDASMQGLDLFFSSQGSPIYTMMNIFTKIWQLVFRVWIFKCQKNWQQIFKRKYLEKNLDHFEFFYFLFLKRRSWPFRKYFVLLFPAIRIRDRTQFQNMNYF